MNALTDPVATTVNGETVYYLNPGPDWSDLPEDVRVHARDLWILHLNADPTSAPDLVLIRQLAWSRWSRLRTDFELAECVLWVLGTICNPGENVLSEQLREVAFRLRVEDQPTKKIRRKK